VNPIRTRHQQLLEPRPALAQWALAQVAAVAIHQVEDYQQRRNSDVLGVGLAKPFKTRNDRDPRPISAAISWHEQVERAEGDEDDQRGDQRLHGGDRSRDGRRRQCRERDTVDCGSPSPAADVAVPVSVNLPMLINHHISSMIPPEGMARPSRLVARAVVENSPFVRCFRCLSQQAGVPEKDAREAGQRLVRRHEFSIARRECQHCGRIDDVLVSGKAA
jgi:hypothetical protein